MLQDVGLDVDRFGEPASRVDVGEVDQEQHDAVTDVFAVPSACFLVRADLFRALGGFDAAMSFHGEDVDLCWRAHISGARVMVAPAARVRHREQLESRRPDLNHPALRARHQLRSTLTLTAGSRLPGPAARARRPHDRRGRRRRVQRPCPGGVGVGARRARRDPAVPDAARPARRDRQAAADQRRRGARPPVARQQPAGVVPARPRHPAGDRRRRAGRCRRQWPGDRRHPALARALAGAAHHVVGGDRRRARRQPLVHQPLGADDRRVPPVPRQPAAAVE